MVLCQEEWRGEVLLSPHSPPSGPFNATHSGGPATSTSYSSSEPWTRWGTTHTTWGRDKREEDRDHYLKYVFIPQPLITHFFCVIRSGQSPGNQANSSAGTRSRFYADDHCLYKPLSNLNDIAEIQRDIELVDSWSVNNHLQPNALKTKYMIINESLSWSEQVNCVSNRAKRTFIANFTGFTAVELLCLNCILRLCSLSLITTAWSGTHIYWKTLDNLILSRPLHAEWPQKNWSVSDSELQSICHLPSLKTRRMYFKLCFLYKSLNHLTHVPNNLFTYRTSGSQCVSHDLQLFCPRANTNSFLFSFVCSSVKVWNSLMM